MPQSPPFGVEHPPRLWMFDYDGTLTPITPQPDEAVLPPEGLPLLRRLMDERPIAIVSGRSIAQLQGFLGALAGWPLMLCGLHGGHIVNFENGETLLAPPEDGVERVQAIATETAAWVAQQGLEGLLLENKGHSVVLHHRHASAEGATRALAFFRTAVAAHNADGALMLQPGKCVLEVMPHGLSKGRAVEFLLEHWQGQGFHHPPAYAGDDLTDEAAFLAVNQRGGLSIRIGDAEGSAAAWALPDVATFYHWLMSPTAPTASSLIQEGNP